MLFSEVNKSGDLLYHIVILVNHTVLPISKFLRD